MSNRMKDAEIAVKQHGWQWVNQYGNRAILMPPDDSPMKHWTAMIDENGIPHYLPKYSEEGAAIHHRDKEVLDQINERWKKGDLSYEELEQDYLWLKQKCNQLISTK